jgi:hypothetical protein
MSSLCRGAADFCDDDDDDDDGDDDDDDDDVLNDTAVSYMVN